MPEQKNIESAPVSPETLGTPEKISSPEQKVETAVEKAVEKAGETNQPNVVLPDDKTKSTPVATDNAVILSQVENILSQNMDKVFLSMDSAAQQQFKAKGEETAKKIVVLMQKSKVKVQAVATLILEWLRIIPKVNKHYIEQEAKIKAEAIMKAHNKE